MYNFAAGPAAIPASVLQRARDELLTRGVASLALIEAPFTGPAFRSVVEQAHERLRALLALQENYRVVFMAGGAMAQFGLLPLNLLGGKTRVAYVDSGYWAGRAIAEAQRHAAVEIAASAWRDTDGLHLPPPSDWRIDPAVAYCHFTANETADGAEFQELTDSLDTSSVALACDMTSSFLVRPLDVSRFGVIYAGAQKNLGPAGLTVVVIRDDLLGRSSPQTPDVFNYGIQAAARSCHNTPPTLALALANLMFEWIADHCGLIAMARANREKSALLYAAIADSDGFYRCPVAPGSRSRTNVCFQLATEALTGRFIQAAEADGLHNLRGHGRVGGIRASLYNAVPLEAATALVAFMADFQARSG